MKIVIDARMINMSGIGRYLRSLLPELLSLRENQYLLLGNEDELRPFLSDNVEVEPISTSIYNPIEHWVLKKKIPPCDIYFSPHFITPVFRIPARKRISTIHDFFHLSEEAEFSTIKKLYLKILYRNALNKSDKVVTVSHFSSSEIIKFSRKSARKIEVIHNYIDRNLFCNQKGTSPVVNRYILFVGNIKPHKNLVRLVSAFNEIDDENLNLVIVGDRDGFINGIPDFDRILGSNPRIIFTGRISDSHLVSYYSNAELLAFPSLYEGFGYPPIEAMSCGTAVAASDIPVVREICGNSVLYFNPINKDDMKRKIIELLGDKELREKLISDGLKKCDEFTKESFIEKHFSLFQL